MRRLRERSLPSSSPPPSVDIGPPLFFHVEIDNRSFFLFLSLSFSFHIFTPVRELPSAPAPLQTAARRRMGSGGACGARQCRCFAAAAAALEMFFSSLPPDVEKLKFTFHLARSPQALCVVFTRTGSAVALPRQRKKCDWSKDNSEQTAVDAFFFPPFFFCAPC